jgi:hypothetical protein
MTRLLTLVFLIAPATFVWGQAATPAPAASTPAAPATAAGAAPAPLACSKNVSFAIAEGGQPVPAIPKFTLKWLEGKSRKEQYSKICFSQIPSGTLQNYVVVFSSSAAAFNGLTPSAHTYSSSPHEGDNKTPVSSYGGTWSYAYTGVAPPATTDTLALQRDEKPKSLDVRAFDQTGRSIASYSLATISSRDKLLEKVLSDILADSPTNTAHKTLVPSPLSVYYVNCDVDAPPASLSADASAGAPGHAAKAPDPPAPPPPPPPPQLDVSSTPVGADIFVDGRFVGQTPGTLEISEGEHTVDVRKKGYAIWQRRVVVSSGTRKVSAYLEQRELDLQ